MAVKDLVELFDPETTSRRLSSTRSQADFERRADAFPTPGPPQEGSPDFRTRHAPPKFLAHPLLRHREPSQADDDGEDIALLTDAQSIGQRQDNSWDQLIASTIYCLRKQN